MWIVCIVIMSAVIPVQTAFMTGATDEDQKAKKGVDDKSKKTLANASANKLVGEAVMGIRTIASFNLEQVFYKEFAKSTATVAYIQKRDSCVAGFFIGLMAIMMVAFGGIMFYSVWLGNEGVVDFEKALAPMFAVMGVMVPMMKAAALADLKSATVSATRLFKLFNRVPAIDNLSEEGGKPASVTGAIEVRDVVFAYPTAKEHNVCNGYSLAIPAGQTVALCGPSGSGKSTIIQLIERFYDPESGSIMLDGVDIKTLNVRWLRQHRARWAGAGALPGQRGRQHRVRQGGPHGVAGRDRGGRPDGQRPPVHHGESREGLRDRCRAQAGKLSGGQKQRVAIARRAGARSRRCCCSTRRRRRSTTSRSASCRQHWTRS